MNNANIKSLCKYWIPLKLEICTFPFCCGFHHKRH